MLPCGTLLDLEGPDRERGIDARPLLDLEDPEGPDQTQIPTRSPTRSGLGAEERVPYDNGVGSSSPLSSSPSALAGGGGGGAYQPTLLPSVPAEKAVSTEKGQANAARAPENVRETRPDRGTHSSASSSGT